MSNEGIELEIYGYQDPTTHIGTLHGAIEPQILEEIGNIGGGSFKINTRDKEAVDHPEWLKSRNIVKHRVDGKIIGGWLIGTRQATTIDENPSEEGYEIAGEGLKSWFDDARVDPFGGFRATSRDTRAFSFASEEGEWYDSTKWIDPIQQHPVLSKVWTYGPDKWPEGATGAWWVWGTANSNPSAPVGTNYFRIKLPVSKVAEYKLYIALDDNYSVYLDGEEIAKYADQVDGWQEAKKVSLGELDVGTHTIGIRGTNVRGAAGLAAAIFSVTPRVPPTTVGTVTIPIGTTPNITRNNHGLTSGTKVYLTTTGTLPGGLEPNTNYYVTQPTTNTFKLSKSKGGPTINTTGSQSGTHTVVRSEVGEIEKIVTFSGMNVSTLTTQLSAAQSTVNTRQNSYNALPAGNPSGNNTQKKQATAKANAMALLQTAQQARDAIQAQLTAANAAVNAGITWKVLPYPDRAPGWTPGEILLTLLSEADARGVRMASLLTPNFTALVDSEGEPWEEPIDWSFKVGDSMLSVVSKLEEMSCDIWIDPETYELNVVNKRGTDRSIYTYDVDGITVLKSPVIFSRGKNLRKAQTQSKGKMKNSLALKTEIGWLADPEIDEASVGEYGALETTLDTGASTPISRMLAEVIFVQRAQEEEGASYDVYLPPEGMIPHVDFKVGDWVLAPNEQGLSVKRRIMSISTEASDSGRPVYTMEFDTIFRDNEDRINTVLSKLGGGGVSSSYSNAGGVGKTSPSAPTPLPPPDYVMIQTIPKVPTDLEAFSRGYWSANGVKAYGEVTLTWAPVTQNTDDSDVIPAYYEVWGRPSDATEDAIILLASVTQPTAVMNNFEPDTTWAFFVLAWNGGRASGRSIELEHIIAAPDEPMIAPSKPGLVTSQRGLVRVYWDGLMSDGQAPPPQFRYVYAEHRVTEPIVGGWVPNGNLLQRDGRQITMANLPIGYVVETRLTAVDGAGLKSAASEASDPVEVMGVDLGDLEEQVTDAIEAAQNAADAAAGIADAAQIAADIARGLADANMAGTGQYILNPTFIVPQPPGPFNGAWYNYSGEGGRLLDTGQGLAFGLEFVDGSVHYINESGVWAAIAVQGNNVRIFPASSILKVNVTLSYTGAFPATISIGRYGYGTPDKVVNLDSADIEFTYEIPEGSDYNIPLVMISVGPTGGGTQGMLITKVTLVDITAVANAQQSANLAQNAADAADAKAIAAQNTANNAQIAAGDAQADADAAKATASALIASAENKIVDPSFSNGQWNLPGGWAIDSDGRTDSNSLVGNAGSGSANINVLREPGTNTYIVIPTVVGEVWEFGGWYRTTEDWNGTEGNSKLRLANQTANQLGWAPATPSTEWTRVSKRVTIKTSPETTGLRLTLVKDHTAGKIWWDDLWLKNITDVVQAEEAAAAAQDKADQAFSNAAAAAVAAGNAQDTADGKNRVWYQTEPPAGTGHKVNDVWFDTNAGYAMAFWNGSSWGAAPLGTAAIADAAITNAKISALDAGKITTGFLAAARLEAKSITADKLLIGDFTNHIEDPEFETGFSEGSSWPVYPGSTSTTGWGTLVSSTTNINRYVVRTEAVESTIMNSYRFPVRAGQHLRLSALSYALNPDGIYVGQMGVAFFDATGEALVGANALSLEKSTSWEEIVKEIIVSDNIYFASVFISHNGDPGTTLRVANPRLELMDAGELIVDGTITGTKIAAETITGDKILANTIGVSKLLVTNLSNLIEDGSFEYYSTAPVTSRPWILPSGSASITTSSPRTGSHALQVNAQTSAAYVAARTTAAFQVEEGQQYRVEGWVRIGSGTVADSGVVLRFIYGTTEGTTSTTSSDIALTPEDTSTAYELLSGVWTVPAGAKWARLDIVCRDRTAGKVYIVDDVAVYKMANGELIVDGAITSNKVAADSIVGRHIQAGSIDTPHLQAQSVTTEILASQSVTAEQIAAGAIETNHISAGSVKTSHISSEVGEELNIANNTNIRLIVGPDGLIPNLQDGLNSTNTELTTMQQYYDFGPEGAVISKPGSVFATRIDNDSIDMLENGNVISYWNSGTMYVNQLVGELVTLGNHQLAKFEGGTIIRYMKPGA